VTERLRYTGVQPTSFRTGNVGHVEPQGEFDVRDEDAGRFLVRGDVEHADCPAPPCRCGKEPVTVKAPAGRRRRRTSGPSRAGSPPVLNDTPGA
jgi:hypothetical protein